MYIPDSSVPFLMNFSCWKCADDRCLGAMVSLLIGLLYASLQLPWIIAKIKTREMSVWAKFAEISSRENFYLYSNHYAGEQGGTATHTKIEHYLCTISNLSALFLKNNTSILIPEALCIVLT